MRTKKIIKSFTFENERRSEITLGPNTRLHPQNNNIQLLEGSSGYPTDSDLYIKTEVFNPKSVVQFTGFDVYAVHTKKYDGTYFTSLGFRLCDGTNEYFWNGSGWEVNVVDWNTESEISANIGTFSTTSKMLQIVLNLLTTDSDYTPVVNEVRVLYESNIDFQDDLVFNSIVPAFRTIEPISDYIITMTSTTDTIDLNDFPLQTPYDIANIDSCFNYTNDPNKLVDVFSSYNPSTKTITLTGDIDSGEVLWIKFIYSPVVSVSTDQEYVEVSKLPAIHILGIDVIRDILENDITVVRNKALGTAVKVTEARQKTFQFTVAVLTSSQLDQQRLQDEVRQFFADNKYINFNGLDVKHTMYMSDEFSMQTDVKDLSTYTGVFRFTVENVVFYMKTENVYIVEQLEVSGDLDVTVN